MKLVFSRDYEVNIGEHVFPMKKYRLIYETLKDKAYYQFIESCAASDEDILLVHTEEYLDKIKNGRLSIEEELMLELPYSKHLAWAALLACGGSILAAEIASQEKVAVHIGGGFHHAYPDHGEGFCVFNDIAVAIRVLQKRGIIKKGLIIDCDLHQGNGSAAIFKDDTSVFTFSIHEEDNYPLYKEKSSLDIGLEYNCDDEEYLQHLKQSLPGIVKEHNFDIICYVAGADVYREDQLGHLDITIDGLRKRDEFIFSLAKECQVNIFAVLAGGYARDIKDTVNIHCNMIEKAREIFFG